MQPLRRGFVEVLECRRLLAGITSNESIQAAINAPGEVDEYTFTAAPGDSIVVAVGDLWDLPFSPAIELRDPLNAQLGIDTGPIGAGFIATGTVAGTYTLRVADAALASTGTYRVTMVRAPAAQAAGEEAILNLSSGADYAGTLTPGDLDAFTFGASAGAALHVALGDLANSTLAPLVRVFAPNGAIVAQFVGGLVAQGSTVGLPQTGTYTVVAQDLGVDDTGDYQLSIAVAPAAQAPTGDGGELANNASKYGQFGIGDLDVFTFAGAVGQQTIVAVGDLLANAADPTIDIYDPNGAPVGAGSGAAAASVFFTPAIPGTYTAVVRDSGSNDAGAYRINQAVAGAPFSTDPVDPDGGVLQPGRSVRGHITIADSDIYSLNLTAGQTARIVLGDLYDVPAVPELRVYDTSGVLIGSDTDGIGAEFSFTAGVNGAYTIIAGELNRDEAYRYSLVAAVVVASNNGDQWDNDFGNVASGESRFAFLENGDVDVFSVLAAPSQAITVSVKEFGGTSISPQIDVYGPTGVLVGSDNDPTEAIVGFGNGGVAATYTIVVRDLGTDNSGAYTISINTPAAAVDTRNPTLLRSEYLFNQPQSQFVMKFSEPVGASLGLAALATAWQTPGRSFAEGNANYDAVVDITDLAALATNWQKSLPARAQAPHRVFAGGPRAAQRISAMVLEESR